MDGKILSLRELEIAMIEIPLPFPASLIAAFGLTYSDSQSSIWAERRSSNIRERCYANPNSVVSPRYSRRMNQGARD